jgi:hypothetical protein
MMSTYPQACHFQAGKTKRATNGFLNSSCTADHTSGSRWFGLCIERERERERESPIWYPEALMAYQPWRLVAQRAAQTSYGCDQRFFNAAVL